MGLLLRSEIFRLSRRWMPWVLLLIMLGVIALLYSLIGLTVNVQAGAGGEGDLVRLGSVTEFGLLLVSQIGTILSVILGASLIGAEFGWGTIRTLLPRARSRARLLGAKLIVLLLFVILVVLLGSAAALGMSALVTELANLQRDTPDDFAWLLLTSVARTGYTILPYALLAFLIALLSRSNAAGIGVSLAVYFLEDLLVLVTGAVGDALEWVKYVLIGPNVDALLTLNDVVGGIEQPSDLPDPWQAAGVLALYMLGFIVLAFWGFRRRDITSG